MMVGDAEEGLEMLLGGLSSKLMKESCWNELIEDIPNSRREEDLSKSSQCMKKKMKKKTLKMDGKDESKDNFLSKHCVWDTKSMMERAFSIHPSRGTLIQPPVQIIDMSTIGRGYALEAKSPISRGQIIYTEKSLESAQIPIPHEDIVPKNDEMEDRTSNMTEKSEQPYSFYKVKGCQHCFRSMEPASTLCTQPVIRDLNENTHDNERNEKEKEQRSIELPMTHLWPVPEYTMKQTKRESQEESVIANSNTFGIICSDCGATFCSIICHQAHNKSMGNCCICTDAMFDVCSATKGKQSMRDNDFNTEIRLDESSDVVNPVFILAARMFCSAVHRHRNNYLTHGEFNDKCNEQFGYQEDSKIDEGSYPFYFMCGDESDISKLELGIRKVIKNIEPNKNTNPNLNQMSEKKNDGDNLISHESDYYTMEHIYSSLVNNVFTLTDVETKYFSLSYFHKLVATVARNAIGVTTQSPFKAYYSALLRNCPGGRCSKQHLENMRQVALTLGAKDGKLNKQMDRDIENRCAIQTISIFTLTSRINHSCDPCAEVQSQKFVDNHIDVVALRDIKAGEEITISYINLGRNAGRQATDRTKRMRELKSRYLFICECSRCTTNLEEEQRKQNLLCA